MTALRLAAVLAASCLSMGALAQAVPDEIAQRPWFKQFQRDLRAAWVPPQVAMQGDVAFVVGNDIVRTGSQFKSGNDWLALSCAPSSCRFEPAALAAVGQHLRFRIPAAPSAKAVAWFETGKAPAWLAQGDVPTYYRGDGRPRDAGRGSDEAVIDLPDGTQAQLVPMLLHEPSGENRRPPVLLQLRTTGKRQFLLGLLGRCSFTFDSARYLLWAGDLDRDGKADYLISFVDGDGPIHLYLSSAAKAGQLVGLVGAYNAPASNVACRGNKSDD